MRGDISLSVPVGEQVSTDDMEDRLADPSPDPESLVAEAEERMQVRTAVNDALAVLTSRERCIVEARYLNERPSTLEELSRSFGVSRERVRQIECRALQKIESALSADRARPQTSGAAPTRASQRGANPTKPKRHGKCPTISA
jgi:RNA polymerase sigma-32 factor